MVSSAGWYDVFLSPQWVVAFGTLAALGLSAYNIVAQRRDEVKQQRADDMQAGAEAYALKGVLNAWSTSISKAKDAPPDRRAVVFRDIFKEIKDTDRRFARLTATASGASAHVREEVAEGNVLYHEVAKRIRTAARNPELDKTVGQGQIPDGMGDASIADLTMLLRSSRRALSRLTPQEIQDAREVYWPTPPKNG